VLQNPNLPGMFALYPMEDVSTTVRRSIIDKHHLNAFVRLRKNRISAIL